MTNKELLNLVDEFIHDVLPDFKLRIAGDWDEASWIREFAEWIIATGKLNE